ncbi:T9SS type A sorting domain-containing protein [candidate division KSB1 bacterium]
MIKNYPKIYFIKFCTLLIILHFQHVLLFGQDKYYKPQINENVTLVGTWADGQCYSFYLDNGKAYVGNGSFFEVINVIYPANPASISNISLPSVIKDIFVVESYAYTANFTDGLRIININDPSDLSITGSFNTGGQAEGVFVSGDYAYIADGDSGLCIVNISNPSIPLKTGSYKTSGYSQGVSVSGNHAYLAAGDYGLKIINISDPSNPGEAGSYDTDGSSKRIFISGEYAYLADGIGGLKILDISITASPYLVSGYTPGTDFSDVFVSNNYAYIADVNAGVRIINISDLQNPYEAGNYSTDGVSKEVISEGNHIYLGIQDKGLYILKNDLLKNEDLKLAMDIEKEFSSHYDSTNSLTDMDKSTNFYLSLYAKDVFNLNSYTAKVSFDTSKISYIGAKEKLIFVENNILGSSGYTFSSNVNKGEVSLSVSRTDSLGVSTSAWGFLGYIQFRTRSSFSLSDSSYFIYTFSEFIDTYNDTANAKIENPEYTFNAVLNRTQPIVLPVELLFFDAVPGNNFVRLEWITASELNNFGFEVQRSNDGRTFDKGGLVQGGGTTDREKAYEYTDKNLTSGIYFYRLKQIDYDGKEAYSDIVKTEIEKPEHIKVYSNYPNPFNSETNIRFDIKEEDMIKLQVYSITGQVVSTLVSKRLLPGYYNIKFNSKSLSSGVYFYTLKSEKKTISITKKFVLLK